MYKTGIITDEVSQDLKIAAKLAQEFGLDALEIRSVKDKNPFQMNKEDYMEIKSIADDFGFEICAISSPVFKCDLYDRGEYLEHLDGLKRCVEAANILGATIVRSFSFWNTHKGTEDFLHIIDKYQQAIDIAKDGGVVLALESEPSVCTSNIKLLTKLLEQMNSQYVGALFDPGNEIADELADPPYPEGYERIKAYIKHVHLKDLKSTTKNEYYEPALIGEGDVDYHGILSCLKADDYQGYVCVETHFRFRQEQLEEELLKKPQGYGFSDGGERASRAYLEILRNQYNWQRNG